MGYDVRRLLSLQKTFKIDTELVYLASLAGKPNEIEAEDVDCYNRIHRRFADADDPVRTANWFNTYIRFRTETNSDWSSDIWATMRNVCPSFGESLDTLLPSYWARGLLAHASVVMGQSGFTEEAKLSVNTALDLDPSLRKKVADRFGNLIYYFAKNTFKELYSRADAIRLLGRLGLEDELEELAGHAQEGTNGIFCQMIAATELVKLGRSGEEDRIAKLLERLSNIRTYSDTYYCPVGSALTDEVFSNAIGTLRNGKHAGLLYSMATGESCTWQNNGVYAVQALERMGEKGRLLKLLRSGQSRVDKTIVESLKNLGAIQEIREAVDYGYIEGEPLILALGYLAEHFPNEYTMSLAMQVNTSRSIFARSMAIRTLQSLATPLARTLLSNIAGNNSDNSLRFEAADALLSLNGKKHAQLYIAAANLVNRGEEAVTRLEMLGLWDEMDRAFRNTSLGKTLRLEALKRLARREPGRFVQDVRTFMVESPTDNNIDIRSRQFCADFLFSNGRAEELAGLALDSTMERRIRTDALYCLARHNWKGFRPLVKCLEDRGDPLIREIIASRVGPPTSP